jgi:hypothetical protein
MQWRVVVAVSYDHHLLPEYRPQETAGEVLDTTTGLDDCILYPAVMDLAAVAQRYVWPDKGILKDAVLSDETGTCDDGVTNAAADSELECTAKPASLADIPVYLTLNAVQVQPIGTQQCYGLSGILPEAAKDGGNNTLPVLYQPLDRVGDFIFPARRGLDAVYRLENRPRERIDADDGKIARGLWWLLYESLHGSVLGEYGDPKMLWICDLSKHERGGGALVGEIFDEALNADLEEVITQEHDEGAIRDEIPRAVDGMGQSERLGLHDICDLDIPGGAITYIALDGLGLVSHNEGDLFNAGFTYGIQGPAQEGLAGYRQ